MFDKKHEQSQQPSRPKQRQEERLEAYAICRAIRGAPTLLLIMAGLLFGPGAMLFAQYSDYCVVELSGENRDRTIGAGASISTECADGDSVFTFIPGVGLIPQVDHSAPFGNWGVSSNYGSPSDGNQFPGWDSGTVTGTSRTNWQWNSCTTLYPPSLENGRYYNWQNSTAQQSVRDTETHGTRIYRIPIDCNDEYNYLTPSEDGCTDVSVPDSMGVSSNFMSLYELDFDGNDLVTTLYFPGTSATLECTYYGCSEEYSDWVDVTSSTRSYTQVDAQVRTKVSAYYEAACGWN